MLVQRKPKLSLECDMCEEQTFYKQISVAGKKQAKAKEGYKKT